MFGGEHGRFGTRVGIAEARAGHEPVELGLRQRIGAFEFDRILRGHDEIRVGQRVGGAVDADLPLPHGLEHGGLRLGIGSIHLVGDDDVGEQRPGVEGESARGLLVDADAGQVGGQHVRRELDAAGGSADGEAQRPGQRGLANARDVLEQQMAARGEGVDGQLDDLAGTGEHAGQRVDQAGDGLGRGGRRIRGDWHIRQIRSGRADPCIVRHHAPPIVTLPCQFQGYQPTLGVPRFRATMNGGLTCSRWRDLATN